MRQPRVLMVDDNQNFLDVFAPMVEAQGLRALPSDSPAKALEILDEETVDLIISDVQMPEMSGLDLFRMAQERRPDIPVILITAYGSTEDAIRAVKDGAFHYFEKPLDDKLELFWTTVREALAKREMVKELNSLRKERSFRTAAPIKIIGQSDGIKKVIAAIEEVASLPVTVLISGETGTGKELVARALHRLSDRKKKAFIAVNCTEFAAGVLESELFGHEKGAFTGAIAQKAGLFDVADGGVLFLDEIGEAPPAFQSKLLRVLETKTFTRVGGTVPVYSDFRLITATNRKLQEDVNGGHFRQDLFYRLNVFCIPLPPLRQRKEDIPLIADFYIRKFSRAYRRRVEGISPGAMLALREYDWPGNVRELINVVERAVITCRGALIATEHLPFGASEEKATSDLNLKNAERFFITAALIRTENNKSKAAELLGISRKTLIDKVRAYGLDESLSEP